MRKIFSILAFCLLASTTSLFAADGGHHALPLNAQPLFGAFTNSTIMVWIAVACVVFFTRVATRKMSLVPSGVQNFAEWMVETLYSFLETLLGPHLTKRTFWFFGSIFFLILLNNYMGLIPGVGTVGSYVTDEHGHKVLLPFLRGGNADLNMTAAMSSVFAVLWFYWAITENGVKGFLAHIFAPKGKFGFLMMFLMVPIFLFVGLLEVMSIAIRPIALSFRLFGNIYGGEQTLESLMSLVPEYIAFMPALPFYFMELLVGFVQAFVFTLLCSIFLKLICEHADEEHH
jgi:F-type H+-transporting ATPase subunit a